MVARLGDLDPTTGLSFGALEIGSVGGWPELFLEDQLIPEDSLIELYRAGTWHWARTGLDPFLRPCVQVLSKKWPGGPCVLNPTYLFRTPARLLAIGEE
jgi:hypothetical protein